MWFLAHGYLHPDLSLAGYLLVRLTFAMGLLTGLIPIALLLFLAGTYSWLQHKRKMLCVQIALHDASLTGTQLVRNQGDCVIAYQQLQLGM